LQAKPMKQIKVFLPNSIDFELFKIDDDDFEKCLKYNWKKHSGGYARASISGKWVYLHRFLLNASSKDPQIDHINRDKKDNQKSNLRFISGSQNVFNQDLRCDNKIGISGIHWDNIRKKYFAQITKNNKNYFIGRFSSLEDAMLARKKKEIELFNDTKTSN
jgi:hypothetical protein